MEFKNVGEEVTHYSKTVTYDIEIPSGEVIRYWKHSSDDDLSGMDSDSGFCSKDDEQIYDALTEDEQQEFMDFVDEI